MDFDIEGKCPERHTCCTKLRFGEDMLCILCFYLGHLD